MITYYEQRYVDNMSVLQLVRTVETISNKDALENDALIKEQIEEIEQYLSNGRLQDFRDVMVMHCSALKRAYRHDAKACESHGLISMQEIHWSNYDEVERLMQASTDYIDAVIRRRGQGV